jgi:TonB family protein
VDFLKKHKEGILFTLLFHLGVLFVLLQFGFFTPLPLPEEKGVLIDFGVTAVGMGEVEPAPSNTKAETPPPVAKPVPIKQPVPSKADAEDVMTQDFEKTAAIEAGKKKQLEEELKRKELAEKERRRKDSIQQIEIARQTELKRIAEQRRKDSLQRVQEDAQKSAIDSRAKNAFGGTSGQGTTASTGQGNTYQPGNQGSIEGAVGGGDNGAGSGGGVSFSLTGRKSVALPKPTYPGNNEEGTVVVEITVDRYGKVSNAVPGVKGTTNLNSALLNAAKNAALSTKFSQNLDSPALQTGTITYKFKLNR